MGGLTSRGFAQLHEIGGKILELRALCREKRERSADVHGGKPNAPSWIRSPPPNKTPQPSNIKKKKKKKKNGGMRQRVALARALTLERPTAMDEPSRRSTRRPRSSCRRRAACDLLYMYIHLVVTYVHRGGIRRR